MSVHVKQALFLSFDFSVSATQISELTIDAQFTIIYTTLPFIGNSNNLMLKRRIKLASNRIFHAAQFVIIGKARSKFHHKLKWHANDCFTSHCIYQFTWMCGNTDIGRSDHYLQVRLVEHIHKWPQKQMNSNSQIRSDDKQTSSFITKHLDETGHEVDIESAYVVLYRRLQGSMLRFIETLAIWKLGPLLCIQKPTLMILIHHPAWFLNSFCVLYYFCFHLTLICLVDLYFSYTKCLNKYMCDQPV